jgi:hypothetical protein
MSTARSLRRGDAFLRVGVYVSLACSAVIGLAAFSVAWLVPFITAVLALLLGERLNRTTVQREFPARDPRAEEISSLYRELRQLEAESSGPSARMEKKLSRLRELQSEEAAEMRQRFEASLHLPPGDGRSALQEARRLLGRHEDPSLPDPASRQHG